MENDSLTPEMQKKAIDWLNTHWNNDQKCEICANNSWVVQADLITPSIYNGGILLGKAYPQFMILCTKCGNTKYFNAVISNIINFKDNNGK